ncbi:MAG: DinB family protein [Pyrinomonadaceae bacterium]|nr:DinB family protein [Pyrinomonadaceae bacterium]
MEFDQEKAIEILSRTPAVLRGLLEGLSDEWSRGESKEDSWNPYDVIGHYIHGEKTDWIPRAKIILAQGDSVGFVTFDRLAQFEDSKGKSLDSLLEEFSRLRIENLHTLRSMSLTDDQMDMKGMHPELGEVTLRQLLSTWVVHDLTHIRQIVTVLAGRYSENVGPWREYLSILK